MNMDGLLAEGGPERQHRRRLRALLESTHGPVRIASAYVTDRDLLAGIRDREVCLVTSLLPLDIASGATSLETLRVFIESGVQCRVLPGRPRLHAKVYLFGTTSAVITSANLTESAFDSNIEVGVEIRDGSNIQTLAEWYDRLWQIADPLSVPQLADLRQKAAQLRREYAKLKKKSIAGLRLSSRHSASGSFRDDLRDLLEKATQFFVCNTDRRQGTRTTAGGFVLEDEMHNRGYAAAWESFKFPDHVQQVEPGDAIFMFAKGVGIIGVGRARATCEVLEPNNPDRIRNFSYEENTREWRVPVHWLVWRDEEDAYSWKAPNFTFWNVSDEQYAELREGVRQHFLSD